MLAASSVAGIPPLLTTDATTAMVVKGMIGRGLAFELPLAFALLVIVARGSTGSGTAVTNPSSPPPGAPEPVNAPRAGPTILPLGGLRLPAGRLGQDREEARAPSAAQVRGVIGDVREPAAPDPRLGWRNSAPGGGVCPGSGRCLLLQGRGREEKVRV